MAKKPKDDEYKTYYEQGEQAAWRGESADAMPNFRRGLRASAWQKCAPLLPTPLGRGRQWRRVCTAYLLKVMAGNGFEKVRDAYPTWL